MTDQAQDQNAGGDDTQAAAGGDDTQQQQQDQQPADTAPTVPEKYELTRPEGVPEGITLDEAKFTAWAKETGLSQAEAQEAYAALLGERAAFATEQAQKAADQRKTWQEEIRKSPTFDADQKAIGKLMDEAHAPKELREFLNITGLGDHPGFFGFMASLAKKLGEPGHVSQTDTQVKEPISLEKQMYPNLP